MFAEKPNDDQEKFIAINRFGSDVWSYCLSMALNGFWIGLSICGWCGVLEVGNFLWIHQFIGMCWHLIFDPNYHFLARSWPLWAAAVGFNLCAAEGCVSWKLFNDNHEHNKRYWDNQRKLNYVGSVLPKYFGFTFRNAGFGLIVFTVYFFIAVAATKLWTKCFFVILIESAFGHQAKLSQIPFELWLWVGYLALVALYVIHVRHVYSNKRGQS